MLACMTSCSRRTVGIKQSLSIKDVEPGERKDLIMVRLRDTVLAVMLITGGVGCATFCDECDDFPVPGGPGGYSMLPGSYTGSSLVPGSTPTQAPSMNTRWGQAQEPLHFVRPCRKVCTVVERSLTIRRMTQTLSFHQHIPVRPILRTCS